MARIRQPLSLSKGLSLINNLLISGTEYEDRLVKWKQHSRFYICMAKCNKDTAGNRHVARCFHHVRQGSTVLKEQKFEWIRSKFQLADILFKV